MPPTEGEILGRLREAVLALKDVRSQRDALLREKTEPIAIIGTACRFPGGGTTPERFYQSLLDGMDAVTAIPPDRWEIDSRIDKDPKMQGTRWGSFIENVDLFDPSFFDISPREAERMDPQQRILLETTWEVLERSGIVPGSLAGSKTGVFLGVLHTDYFHLNLSMPRPLQDIYSATGNAHCFPAGRIAYTFGFQGPAFAVDTACSSSLVATHLGCHSLRKRETDLALVGGVSLMLDPLTMELMGKIGALSPDGRCKSFDARANGIARGEGCGVLLLKRLSDAQRDGDSILALIIGSAVNQDGRSSGLTTPNALAQQAMLEEALANSQLSPADIGYIETHGTGTPLGDPIEMEALRAVFGKSRANETRCFVGSVKTNIGHTEAAAGVAGILKTMLALQNEKIPQNLHFRTLNPRISLDGTNMAIASETIAWPRGKVPRRAGVSSFGMSGTNAHVILEEAPHVEPTPPPKERSAYLLPLSAKTPEVLATLATSYAQWLSKNPDTRLDDLIHTVSVRRTHHEHRLAIIATNREQFIELLSSWRDGEPLLGVHRGQASAQTAAKIAFIFPGQGAQWIGMSKALFADEPAFREALEVCDRAILAEGGFSILQRLNEEKSASRTDEIDVLQPLLFAIEVALAALWQSWGISPDCVVGHSMGEVAAAHVAGALSLRDAVAVICRRSRLLRKVLGQGAMAVVELPLAHAESKLVGYEGRLSIAVSNGPRATVIAGDPAALEELIGKLESERVFCQRMKVDAAAHSPQMDPLRADLLAALPEIVPTKNRIAIRSTVTGEKIQGSELTAHYWVRNLREPVKFYQTIQQLIEEGITLFVEVSPQPVLIPFIDETLNERKTTGVAVSSLRWKVDDRRSLLDSLGRLYVHGGAIDWKKKHSDGKLLRQLPTYPWHRQRFWIEAQTQSAVEIPALAPKKESLEDWLFTLDWQPAPLPENPTKSAQGIWVIVQDTQGFGANLAEALKKKNERCIRVEAGKEYARLAADHYRINIRNSPDYARLLEEMQSNGITCRGVIHLLGLDAPAWDDTTINSLHSTQKDAITSALYLMQSLVRNHGRDKRRLWLVSRRAVKVEPDDSNFAVAIAPLWGLGRTAMVEHRELGCVCVDLDLAPQTDSIRLLLQELEADTGEEHVAFRSNRRFIGRLARGNIESTTQTSFTIKTNANYLITGGLTGLGLSVAQWMVSQGARYLTLMGRRPPSDEARHVIRDMEQKGAKVLVLACDVAKPEDLFVAFCTMSGEMPDLKGVIHSAGLLEDRTLLELTEEHFQKAFAPKVAGAWNLHALTSNEALDFFVMYSSAASLFGSAGQANYSAANAFLDCLAHGRRSRGLPAMSINWGSFNEIGGAAGQENRGLRLERRGISGLSPADGLDALQRLLENPSTQIAVIRMDVPRWLESFPELASRSLWSNLVPKNSHARPAPNNALPTTAAETSISDKMLEAPPAERLRLMEEHVRAQFSQVLRMEPAKIAREEKIHHYGVDSLMAIELRNRLQASLKIEFSIGDIWTHGSVAELAKLLTEKLNEDPRVAKTLDIAQKIEKRNRPPEDSGAAGQWVVIPKPLPRAKMRLICFPYAGGGAPVFSSWSEKLSPDIEVCAIQPPGRHARMGEPFMASIEAMVDAIVPALLLYLDRPFAMFGHCLGAIIMFEVAKRLSADAWIYPIEMFASAAPTPPKYLVPNVSKLSDDEFLGILRAIGLAQQDVLNDRDIVQTMIPMVRADFDIAARYEYRSLAKIDIPITTFSGSADSFAPSEVVEEWRHLTSAHFSKHTYPGGHYFLVPERDSILQIIRQEMLYRFATTQQQGTRSNPLRSVVAADSPSKSGLRVICFPGLNGSAADYEYLSRCLPPDIEVWAFELPGHGTRVNEAALGRVEDIVNHFVVATRESPLGPCIFVGQDLGALVMYEIALRLQKAQNTLPNALVVLAASAPPVHYFAPIHLTNRNEFAESLSLLGVTLDQATPVETAQADCAALASYSPMATPALPIPITVLVATKDRLIAPASVLRWRSCTTSNFVSHEIECEHNKFASNEEAKNTLRGALARLLSS